jgi:hypothetical protein
MTTKISEAVGVYKQLAAENKLGDVANVFPAKLAKCYRAHPFKKAVEDDMRYRVRMYLSEARGATSREFYENVHLQICRYLKHYSESDLRVLSVATMRMLISRSDKEMEVNAFLNSIFFIYAPIADSDLNGTIAKDFKLYLDPTPDGEGIWIFTGTANVRAEMK